MNIKITTKVDLFLEDLETFTFVNKHEMFKIIQGSLPEWKIFDLDEPEKFYEYTEDYLKQSEDYNRQVKGYYKWISNNT